MDSLLTTIYVSIVSVSIFITIIIVIMSILSERKRQISPQGKKTGPHKKKSSSSKEPSNSKSSSSKTSSNNKSEKNSIKSEQSVGTSIKFPNSLSEDAENPLHDSKTLCREREIEAPPESVPTIATLPPVFEMISEEKRPKNKRKKKRQKQVFETIEESIDSLPVSTIDEENTVPNVKKRKKKRKHKDKDRALSPSVNVHTNEEAVVVVNEEDSNTGSQTKTRKKKRKKHKHRTPCEKTEGQATDHGLEHANIENLGNTSTNEEIVKNNEMDRTTD
ncbi:hypothetical protein FSP39_019271 [Pinctada imbricata]|uniref:Uncharacterized protein n=1 Tax=Pinctada imbricata TaxID=66713 RepID=A0AA88Y5C8_PINIB|nr:hypothetical protein FSP39_019271 [Pinctada imbricata]